jgi:hypothetical protein
MDISIAGYKISLVTLLLIGLVFFVLTGHTICGCCDVQGFDGFGSNFAEAMTPGPKKTEDKKPPAVTSPAMN